MPLDLEMGPGLLTSSVTVRSTSSRCVLPRYSSPIGSEREEKPLKRCRWLSLLLTSPYRVFACLTWKTSPCYS